MAERRFLVVRLGSLGDIVHTFPAVAALRESFPAAEIIWLTHARYKLLVQSSGLASKIWTTETRAISSLMKTIREIRAAGHSTPPSTIKAFGNPPACRFSEASNAASVFPQNLSENLACRFFTLIASTPPARTSPTRMGNCLSAPELKTQSQISAWIRRPCNPTNFPSICPAPVMKNYVVLSPGGGWRSKCWPPERFGALCQKIFQSLSLRCLINYGPGEEDLASKVRAASGDADPVLFNGELGALMSLLRSAVCVVGGDTGPLHLAVALGTPVVALFGPTDPARNGPYRNATSYTSSAQSSDRRIDSPQDIVLRAPNVVTTHSRAGPHASVHAGNSS